VGPDRMGGLLVLVVCAARRPVVSQALRLADGPRKVEGKGTGVSVVSDFF
jgi:hypothetical protein